LALINDCQIPLSFPEIFFDQLMLGINDNDEKIYSLYDLKDIEPEIYSSLINMKKDIEKNSIFINPIY